MLEVPQPAPKPTPALLRLVTHSLSGRLLALTVVFVLLAEVLIFVPSLATFHRNWLQERVNAAQIAALALEAAPEMAVTESLRRELLENAEVKRVALKRDGARELRLDVPMPELAMPIHTIDLRDTSTGMELENGLETFFAPKGRLLRVLAKPRFETGEFIEVVLNEAPLKKDMGAYAKRILFTSILVSVVTASLVFFTLNAVLVRPMRRLTSHIERFRDKPEDATREISPSARQDEIGRAERALAVMERDVRSALRQRERLAGLGAAVAKIAHDLRNSLATAQIVTERLAASEDPGVRQSAPRLERAISRAGALAEAALRYGRAEDPAPKLQSVNLAQALNEAADDALAPYPAVQWRNAVATDMSVSVDPEHLHRIVANLARNAAQAMEQGGVVSTSARRAGDSIVVELQDTGPGIPEAARAHLFEPFAVASRQGGSGLGLAIARELARAMGGDLQLATSAQAGACFAITLRAG